MLRPSLQIHQKQEKSFFFAKYAIISYIITEI